jgi:hypothetical protein
VNRLNVLNRFKNSLSRRLGTVLPGPACRRPVIAWPLSPILSRMPPLTLGPPSRSGPCVSRPHRVARTRSLPCSCGNATARARRPRSIAGRLVLPTAILAPPPPLPSSSFPHGLSGRTPLPFFPLCPTQPSCLKSRRLLLHPLFSSLHPFPPPPSPRPHEAARASGAAGLP